MHYDSDSAESEISDCEFDHDDSDTNDMKSSLKERHFSIMFSETKILYCVQ